MVVMTTRARGVVLVVALALAASLLTLAVVLAKPAQAQAETTTSTDRSTFNQTFFNFCTGEFILIQGSMHAVAHTTTDANGERHTKIHTTIQGVGESESGAHYVFHDVFNLQENFPAGDPNYNVTFTGTTKLIRQGSATPTDDLEVKLLLHQTINSQGVLTSEITKAEGEECT